MSHLKHFQHTYLLAFLIMGLMMVMAKAWHAHSRIVPGPVEIRNS